MKKSLSAFYLSAFFKSQLFLLPVLYLFYIENGLNLDDFYFFQGLIFIVNVLLQIPIGFLGDIVSRKKLICISYLFFFGRIIVWLSFRGYWVIFLGEMFYAVSKGIFDAVESPYIYDVLSQKNKFQKMTKSYSKLNFALSLGTSISALSGAWLYEKYGADVLLLFELVLISAAIICTAFISDSKKSNHNKIKYDKNIIAVYYKIFKNCQAKYFILYSGLLVAFSHFFFWSFQPLMKMSMVPVYCFGIIYFINNVLRASGSLLTNRLLQVLNIRKMVFTCFILDALGIAGVITVLLWPNDIFCMFITIYLSISITLQLMFTIAHISNLQKIAKEEERTKLSSVNMMISRTFAGLLLIGPKQIIAESSLLSVYLIYGVLFVFVSVCLIRKLISIRE